MKIATFPKQAHRTIAWSGGTTTEYFIFPLSASYMDRNFSIRISSATVEVEESDFTILSDYQRLITPLSGTLRLSFEETGESIVLEPLAVAQFNGAYHTHAVGKAVDFNVMYHKGMEANLLVLRESVKLRAAKYRFLFLPSHTMVADAGAIYVGSQKLQPDTLYFFPTKEEFVVHMEEPISPVLYIRVNDTLIE